MKKPKKEPTAFSRRQFIGSCAAGASLLQIAPYLSLTGCTAPEDTYPPISDRKYYPLAFTEDEYRKLDEGTYPILETLFKDGIEFKLTFPGFYSFEKHAKIHLKDQQKKKFQYISLDKLGWSNVSGRPELPFFGFLLHIPKFLNYEWDKELNYSGESDNMVVYPSQVRYFDSINNRFNYEYFEYDQIYYESDIEPYENQVVQVSDPFDIGYSRFVLIKVKPLLFNPKQERIHGYSRVNIKFKFKKTPMQNRYYLETPFLPPHLEYIPKHERILDPWSGTNPDGSRNLNIISEILNEFDPDIDKDYIESGSELLIIYGEDQKRKITLAEPAENLKNHKIEMGMSTTHISYPELLSNPDVIKISDYIRNYRQPRFEGNTIYFSRLRNVIILGDLDLIPCKHIERVLIEENDQDSQTQSGSGTVNNSERQSIRKKFYADYYCATLKDPENRNEVIIPDIAIGRIPAKDEDEANTVVENIIHYETNPYQVRQNLTFAGYFQDTGKDGYQCNGVASTDYLQTLEEIRLKLVSRDLSANTIYDIQDREIIQQGLWYRNGEPIDNPSSMFTDVEDLKDRILDAFRTGNRIIVHRDHGYMNGWSRPRFKIPDFWALFDTDVEIPSSVVFNINCLSGHFVGENTTRMPQKYYDCFSEVLLKGTLLPDGIRRNLKCPAVIASVEESPSFHNDWLIKGIFDGIYGGVIGRNNDILTEKTQLGAVVNLGKILLFTCMDDPCLNMYESEIYHVLGDPTILI